MTLVLDTNVVLQARAPGHAFHTGHKPQPITPEAFIRDVLGKA